MARGNQKYWGAAKRGFTQTQTQTVVQVQEKFGCDQCKKEKTRDCFSKSALKKRLHQDLICTDCQDYYNTATNKGFFDEAGWVETAAKVNDEAMVWDFEEGRKLVPSAPRRDVCINNPCPRPAKLTKYPDLGVVAALLMAATVTKNPTGQLKFKSLGLETPKPKIESEWGTLEVPVTATQEEATGRPHHKPILTEAMRKETEGGRWGKAQRTTNIIVPQYARGAAGIETGGW